MRHELLELLCVPGITESYENGERSGRKMEYLAYSDESYVKERFRSIAVLSFAANGRD